MSSIKLNYHKSMKQMHKFIGCTLVIILACCMPCVGFSQETSERSVNNEYHQIIMNYLEQDMSNRQAVMSKEAERIMVNLPNEDKIYDETFIDLKAKINHGKNAQGKKE